MIEVHDIIKEYLTAHGYDGLFGEECACLIDDICPCSSEMVLDCSPGYKTECDGCDEFGDWCVSSKPDRKCWRDKQNDKETDR